MWSQVEQFHFVMSRCKIAHGKVLNELTDIHEMTASISQFQSIYSYSFQLYTSRVFSSIVRYMHCIHLHPLSVKILKQLQSCSLIVKINLRAWYSRFKYNKTLLHQYVRRGCHGNNRIYERATFTLLNICLINILIYSMTKIKNLDLYIYRTR